MLGSKTTKEIKTRDTLALEDYSAPMYKQVPFMLNLIPGLSVVINHVAKTS